MHIDDIEDPHRKVALSLSTQLYWVLFINCVRHKQSFSLLKAKSKYQFDFSLCDLYGSRDFGLVRFYQHCELFLLILSSEAMDSMDRLTEKSCVKLEQMFVLF